MTDEQRKAAVEKAAATYYGSETVMPYEAIERALESVGYFALVEVAEKAKAFMVDIETATFRERRCHNPEDIEHDPPETWERLEAALAKVQP